MSITDLKELAKREKDVIIQHNNGPAVVIAGPGSGKTTTLVERIVNLCCERNCDPSRIIAITFTNAAANEMKTKIAKICNQKKIEKPDIYISTLHAFAKGLLHKYGDYLDLSTNFRILHKFQEKLLLQDARWELKPKKIGRSSQQYLRHFKAQRAFLPKKQIDEIMKLPEGTDYVNQEEFNTTYLALLRYYRCIDWYDVVGLAVWLLRNNMAILEEVSSKINHLVVDEYQDLNNADHQLIRFLSSKAESLMVFGDDDQSIYQTGRYANPAGIARFSAIYLNAKEYPLSICWRCGKKIIDAAWNLVDVSEEVLPERMSRIKPFTNPKSDTGEFEIKRYRSEKAEIQGICYQIETELNNKSQPITILVLFHDRKIGKKYIDELTKAYSDIQNQLGTELLTTKGVFLIRELLYLIKNPSDNLAARYVLVEVCDAKQYWISKQRIRSVKENTPLLQLIQKMNNKLPEEIKQFLIKLKIWQEMENIAEMIIDVTSYLELQEDSRIQNMIQWVNEEDSITMSKIIDYLKKGDTYDVESESVQDTDSTVSKIIVMSMHRAKGLTADVVLIPALEDEFIPNNWFGPEQRRLLYVAMTRARKKLVLSWAWSRSGKDTYRKKQRAITGRQRSGFLDEIEHGEKK